jgi:hypothetical protein
VPIRCVAATSKGVLKGLELALDSGELPAQEPQLLEIGLEPAANLEHPPLDSVGVVARPMGHSITSGCHAPGPWRQDRRRGTAPFGSRRVQDGCRHVPVGPQV